MDFCKNLFVVCLFGLVCACAKNNPTMPADGTNMPTAAQVQEMQTTPQMQAPGSERAARAAAQTY